MRIRPTVRLLVLDEQKRLLLFQVDDKRPLHEEFPGMVVYWNTPGGGLEAGETYQQAALRELWEETGIRDVMIGPWVWYHERIIAGDHGRVQLQERFFIAHVSDAVIDVQNQTAEEVLSHRAYHWWTRQELLVSTEMFQPSGLAQLIQPLLDEQLPTEPLYVPT